MQQQDDLKLSTSSNQSDNQGTRKLYDAVNAMQMALSEILNPVNYNNSDINDPYVSFALRLYSKYNNDMDFHSIMQFPGHMRNSTPQFPGMIHSGLPSLINSNYIYPSRIPYIFPVFPPLPYLKPSSFAPGILEDPIKYERYCMMGSTLLKYIIEVTLFQKDLTFSTDKVYAVVESIINEKSLSLLTNAYNIQLNYKFLTTNVPDYKLILSYLGVFYELNLKDNQSKESWNELYKWCVLILGYNEEEEESKAKEIESITDDNSSIGRNSDTKATQNALTSEHGIPDALNKYLHTVRQDFNQLKTNSVEAIYEISPLETPKPEFVCTLKINDVEMAKVVSVSKKVAQAVATLVLAISDEIFPFLKRSSTDVWFKKYTDNAKEIITLIEDTPVIKVFKSPPIVNVDADLTENNVALDGVTPNSLRSSIEIDTEEESKLKTARNDLYAIMGKLGKYTPRYEYRQLPSGEFEATVSAFPEDPSTQTGVGINKKEAAARAALNYINAGIPIDLKLESRQNNK